MFPPGQLKIRDSATSDDSRFFEGHEGAVLVDGLERAAAELDFHELAELGHPDALALEIGRNRALHHLRDVTADTTLFLGQT